MKKTDGSSIKQTLLFAQQHYKDLQTTTGNNLLEHCKAVARQAETIAIRLYQDVRSEILPDDTKENIAAIIQCALLHDVLNVRACAFETVAEISTVQIAAMVADISRDFRLVETKRDMEFRGRLSQSPVSSQIVVMADIICTAKETLARLNEDGLAVVPKSKKLLTQLDGDLLAIQAVSRYYVLRLFGHAARNLLSDISQKIKACRHKAKLDKLAAQHTTALRERLKNAETEQEAPVKPKKRKDVRYARKRSAE